MEAPAPILDLEASPVPSQLAFAVLDLKGSIIRGQLSSKDATLLFQMLVEAGSLHLEKFCKLSVTSSSTKYVVSRDETHVYVVKTSTG